MSVGVEVIWTTWQRPFEAKGISDGALPDDARESFVPTGLHSGAENVTEVGHRKSSKIGSPTVVTADAHRWIDGVKRYPDACETR